MKIATTPAVAGESSEERELALYEGLRAGRREAFVEFALELDPALRDLALAATEHPDDATRLVRHAWQVVLGGLDLFAWRCSLRAWVAGVLTGLAGQLAPGHRAGVAGARLEGAGRLPVALPGPVDWRDLPWGARWADGVWEALEAAPAALTVVQRQVLALVDVHGWGERDAADALGLTAGRHAGELGAARLAVHEGLARVVGEAWRPRCGHDQALLLARPAAAPRCPDCTVLAARWPPVAGLLASTAPRPPAAPDPRLVAIFGHWRASRRRGLLGALARATARSAG